MRTASCILCRKIDLLCSTKMYVSFLVLTFGQSRIRCKVPVLSIFAHLFMYMCAMQGMTSSIMLLSSSKKKTLPFFIPTMRCIFGIPRRLADVLKMHATTQKGTGRNLPLYLTCLSITCSFPFLRITLRCTLDQVGLPHRLQLLVLPSPSIGFFGVLSLG